MYSPPCKVQVGYVTKALREGCSDLANVERGSFGDALIKCHTAAQGCNVQVSSSIQASCNGSTKTCPKHTQRDSCDVAASVERGSCSLFVDNAAGLTARHLDMLRSRNNPISEHTRPPRSRAAASLDLTPTATCLAFTTLPPVLRLTVCCGHALSRGAAVV